MSAFTKIIFSIFYCSLLWATSSFATDGVLEINQACVAAGCFEGDTADFPVSITSSGSYRLTGNLLIPNVDTTGIEIQAADVTFDLNGFEITCPGCEGAGNGSGIHAANSYSNITVTNGTVRKVGLNGIQLKGNDVHVDRVHVIQTGSIGIDLQNFEPENAGCSVTNSVVRGCGSSGIEACRGPSRISGNLVDDNSGTGISADGNCVISNNVVRSNQFGISASVCVIEGNVARSNTGDGIAANDARITGNNSLGNGGDGIECTTRCVILGNTAISNNGFGLNGGSGANASGYSENYFVLNNGGNANPQVSGGLEIGTNGCGGDTTCP